jgi:pimeloyl-ACP methyl ester carboxylesterase
MDAEHTHLCGVSLGGYVGLEMLVRLPKVFGSFAGVQTAIGEWAAEGYAEKIAKMDPKSLYFLTSSLDHWKKSSDALGAALKARKVACEMRVIPGPHDQPWLREAGTIETLHWIDRLDKAPLP